MTRINLVDVATLHPKHLLAEYRELPRVFGLAERAWLANDRVRPRIPPHYVLGTGHVVFFYDKLQWLISRFNLLVEECDKRGYNITHYSVPDTYKPIAWLNDWTPRPEDIALSAARIAERMPKH